MSTRNSIPRSVSLAGWRCDCLPSGAAGSCRLFLPATLGISGCEAPGVFSGVSQRRGYEQLVERTCRRLGADSVLAASSAPPSGSRVCRSRNGWSISPAVARLGPGRPHTGIGKTGVVASLTVGDGGKSIGLRADIDALAVPEMAGKRPQEHQARQVLIFLTLF